MSTIVFDWDGTLLDSRERHTALLQDVCAQLDLPITAAQLSAYLPAKCSGMSTMRYLTEYCGFSPAVAQSCAQQWVQEIETPPYLRMDSIYGDAHGILSELYGKGFTLALISAPQREAYLLCQVREMGLSAFFHTISCVTPEAAFEEKLKCAQQLPSIVCWAGDTEVDLYASREIGSPFYALGRGFRSRSFWKRRGIISWSNLSALPNVVL